MTVRLYWKHKNLLFFSLGLLLTILLSGSKQFTELLVGLGGFGYFSAIVAGFMFVSTFTVATGGLILLTLAKSLSPLEIVVFGAFGAVLCDFLIFRFVRKGVEEEIAPIYRDFERKHHVRRIIHTKYFAWTLGVLGALIIALPLPDELGISLMGLSKIKTYQFLLISFASHGLGMFLVVAASSLT